MIKYQVKFGEIEKIDVTRETEKTIWIRRKNYLGEFIEDACRKNLYWSPSFDTWQEAHKHLIAKTESAVSYARKQLDNELTNLEKLKNLKQE